MTTKGYYSQYGPYSDEIYYIIYEDGSPLLDYRKKRIRVRVGARKMPNENVAFMMVRNGYFGNFPEERLKKE